MAAAAGLSGCGMFGDDKGPTTAAAEPMPDMTATADAEAAADRAADAAERAEAAAERAAMAAEQAQRAFQLSQQK
jgi:hypothetical protein